MFMQNKDWNFMKLAWDAKQALVSHPKKIPNRTVSILIILECKWHKLLPVRKLSKIKIKSLLTGHTNFIGPKYTSQYNDYLFSERPARINHLQRKKKCK